MSKLSVQDTLESLENSVKDLLSNEEMYEKLKPLTKRINNLLKLDSIANSYKKKVQKLQAVSKSNKKLLKAIEDNIPEFSENLKKKIEQANPQLEKNSIKQKIKQKSLEIYFKQEVSGAVNHIDSLLRTQYDALMSDLKTAKTSISKTHSQKELLQNPPANPSLVLPQKLKLKLSTETAKSSSIAIIKCENLGHEKLINLEEYYQSIIKFFI
jgi:hypothetical protein